MQPRLHQSSMDDTRHETGKSSLGWSFLDVTIVTATKTIQTHRQQIAVRPNKLTLSRGRVLTAPKIAACKKRSSVAPPHQICFTCTTKFLRILSSGVHCSFSTPHICTPRTTKTAFHPNVLCFGGCGDFPDQWMQHAHRPNILAYLGSSALFSHNGFPKCCTSECSTHKDKSCLYLGTCALRTSQPTTAFHQ